METLHVYFWLSGSRKLTFTHISFLHIKLKRRLDSCVICTSEGEMLNTSAILAYSSLTLVNPWMRPVGLP